MSKIGARLDLLDHLARLDPNNEGETGLEIRKRLGKFSSDEDTYLRWNRNLHNLEKLIKDPKNTDRHQQKRLQDTWFALHNDLTKLRQAMLNPAKPTPPPPAKPTPPPAKPTPRPTPTTQSWLHPGVVSIGGGYSDEHYLQKYLKYKRKYQQLKKQL